jgi:Proteolysis_6 C-terminal
VATRLNDIDVRNIVYVGYCADFAHAAELGLDTTLEPLLLLRRSAILVGSLFDVNVPLCSYADNGSLQTREEVKIESDALLAFLGMSAIRSAGEVEMTPEETAQKTTACSPRRFGLVSLPMLFQDLLEMVDGHKCSSCHQVPRTPALCLGCSVIVCTDKSSCPGWAKQHAYDCGAGVCVFLVLKTTGVCVYRNDRLAMWGSPYLDEHGEEDAELRRGKPLFLNRDRYAALERLWLTHGFDQNARILSHTALQ